MIKPLEAVRKIAEWLYDDLLSTGSLEESDIRNEERFIDKLLSENEELVIIKQALTPPTASEVCKELFAELGRDVNYNQQKKQFEFENGSMILGIDTTNNIIFDTYVTPKTFSLIGRFYEGVENERE